MNRIRLMAACSACIVVALTGGAASATSTVFAMVLASAFSMIFGELVPQFLGISAPLRVAKIVARPVQVFAALFKPLIVVLNGSANLLLRSMGIEPQDEAASTFSTEEVEMIVEESHREGLVEAEKYGLVGAALLMLAAAGLIRQERRGRIIWCKLDPDGLRAASGHGVLVGGRVLQGIGGALLLANSTAILTDAFPADQRGMALGINNVAAVAGIGITLVDGEHPAPDG